MGLTTKFVLGLIIIPATKLILIIIGLIGFILICRAAACIINEHERAYGKIKWKWLIFIDPRTESFQDAERELNDIEKELNERES